MPILLLIDENVALIWLQRESGLYLQRQANLSYAAYSPPSGVFPAAFLRDADFYQLVPQTGDSILILPPAFIDLFDAKQLERELADAPSLSK